MPSKRLPFVVEGQTEGSLARAGKLTTLHSVVETPTFMPVGTSGTVKGLRFDEIKATGSKIMLANTYHLLLRPGPEVLDKLGGLHKYCNWDGSILTDSGGFQVFSLPTHAEISEAGVSFKSHIDGRKTFLTPESCIAMQKTIGSDIMMVLDQCVPSTSPFQIAKDAMELTHRWAKRCLEARGESAQSLFSIVQGACFQDLRQQSVDFLSQLPFDGFAIGGLAVGESKSEREDMTEIVAAMLPTSRPRYLMGVGTPIDLLEAVHRGVDMFDCIIPTALSQQGVAYTHRGRLRISRSVYRFDGDPIDSSCSCYTCLRHSKAYLHHLTKNREHLGWHLLSIHNLTYYQQLMGLMRSHILANTFKKYYLEQREILVQGDEDYPVIPQIGKAPRKKPESKLGDYELAASEKGHVSIKQISSGEIMHSSQNPDEEAHLLYIQQADIASRMRLQGHSDRKELIIWDVGLGAGHNAMAAIRTFEKTFKQIPAEEAVAVRMLSFERDLDSLRLALRFPDQFTHLKHSGPHGLMREGCWQSKHYPLHWQLIEGDFMQTMNEVVMPSIIFFDPFSAKVDHDFWTYEFFAKLRTLLDDEKVELFTYSASTAVRAALLGAGFFVAQGAGTGQKPETTIGLTESVFQGKQPQMKYRLLNADWLSKWKKSSAPLPKDITLEQKSDFEEKIRNHPQFLPYKV